MTEEVKPQIVPPSSPPKPMIEISDGLLVPKNIDEAYRVASSYCRSGFLPERFTTPEMVMTAIQFALELGLRPLTALRQMAVIKGTPCFYGDLPLSLCMASGKVEWINEYYFDKDSVEICMMNKNTNAEVYGSVTIVKRRGDEQITESFFTLDDAKRAGLNSPVWKAYPKRMLRYRARSQALKDKFPDALNGISIAEYDHNELPDVKETKIPNKEIKTNLDLLLE
jgi:hypothetical protein